jgi:hypothetical protein
VPALDLARGEIVAVEVAAELSLDAGAQDFHRHLAPAAVRVDHHRLVHLGDGGGGDRRPELGEMIFEPPAERLLHGAARFRHGERRQVVLQQRQLAGELCADDVGARREKLPELDVAGAEAGQGVGEPRLGRRAGAPRRTEPADGGRQNPGEAQRQRHGRPRRDEAHAVLGQHQAGPGEPQTVDDRSGHRRGLVLRLSSPIGCRRRLRRSPSGSRIISAQGFKETTAEGALQLDALIGGARAPRLGIFSQLRRHASRIIDRRRE